MASALHTGIQDGVARIRWDDGKANALSEERITEIGEALDRAAEAEAVAVLSGRDGVFSAGFDQKTFARGAAAGVSMVRAGAELVLKLLRHPHPVLAACTGHAYPAGAFLMLASDARIGVAGPYRIGLNEVAIGMTIPKFAVELTRHRLAGPAFVRITTAVMFEPEEASRLGFLDRVVVPEELEAAVAHEALRLRGLDRAAFAATKARVNQPAIDAIRAAIDEELADIAA